MPKLEGDTADLSSALNWAQYASVGEYILGVVAEFSRAVSVAGNNDTIENNTQLAAANLRVQMRLTGLYQHILAITPPTGPAEKGDSRAALTGRNPQFDPRREWPVKENERCGGQTRSRPLEKSRPGAGQASHRPRGALCGQLAGVSVQLTSSILRACGIVSSAARTIGSVGVTMSGLASTGAVGTSAFRACQDYRAYRRCKNAENKADSVLKQQFAISPIPCHPVQI